METQEQREERIRRLEQQRAERRSEVTGSGGSGTIWPTPPDGVPELPITTAPGRGDLTYGSTFFPSFPTGMAMLGGRTVSFSKLFLSQPWVAACVMRLLAWSIRVPLKAYRRTGPDSTDRIRLRPGDHPIADAILKPWDRASQVDLITNTLGPYWVHGNSATIMENGRDGVIRFTPKDWRFTSPIMPWRDSLEGFEFDIDQAQFKGVSSVDDVLHVKTWSPGMRIGVSPLQQLGVTLRIEDAAQRHQEAQLLNGARPPSAVMASPDFLSSLDKGERQLLMNILRQDVDRLFAGPENAGRPILLPPGLDIKSVAFTSQEAELISQRKLTRDECCAVYLIQPPMLGILDKATFSNIKTQRDMIYTDCLGPPLVTLEQTINAQLVAALLREDDIFVEFDFGGVLRGDRMEEIASLREAIGTALMAPNEGRSILNLPRVDNPAMDEFYMPANNLQPVGSPPTPGLVTSPPPPGQPPRQGRRLQVKSHDRDYEMEFA